MDFGLYEMKILRNNPSSVKSDPRLTQTNDLSPLGSDLSEVYCICIYIYIYIIEANAAHCVMFYVHPLRWTRVPANKLLVWVFSNEDSVMQVPA